MNPVEKAWILAIEMSVGEDVRRFREIFAELLCKGEREVCATLCESLKIDNPVYNEALDQCARSIRSRGEFH